MENSSLEKNQHGVHTLCQKDVCNIPLCSMNPSLRPQSDLIKTTHALKELCSNSNLLAYLPKKTYNCNLILNTAVLYMLTQAC